FVKLVDNGDGTAVLNLAPSYNAAGTYVVGIQVTDGGTPPVAANTTVSITVVNANRAPVLGAISDQTLAEGETRTLTLTATDADGDTLTYSATGLPAFASLSGNVLTLA